MSHQCIGRAAVWAVIVPMLIFGAGLAAATGPAARHRVISSDGRRLSALLDSMKVEQRWLPGDRVDWQTGRHDPDALPLTGHCSAFVAAVAAACHIYVLRPPDHAERLLANSQCSWLRDEGLRQNWKIIDDARTAQRLANQGNLVLACYRNPDRTDPGHIVVVRPSAKSRAAIDREGPDITQAGKHNYSRTSAKHGFTVHTRAWKHSQVLYYAHSVSWGRLAATSEKGGSAGGM
jgi:hypothetical protein